MHDKFLSITDCVHESWSFTDKFLSIKDTGDDRSPFLHFLLATTTQLSSLTTRAGGGARVLVVAVARVGVLVIGAGVGVLAPVAGVVATVLEVGVGDGALAPLLWQS